MNRVTLLGRLGGDPAMRWFADGRCMCLMDVATNETWTDREGRKRRSTDWHRVVAGGRLAENCGRHLCRGRLVLVEGGLRSRRWLDAEGRRRDTVEVQASRVEFLDAPRAMARPIGAPAPAGPAVLAAMPQAGDAARTGQVDSPAPGRDAGKPPTQAYGREPGHAPGRSPGQAPGQPQEEAPWAPTGDRSAPWRQATGRTVSWMARGVAPGPGAGEAVTRRAGAMGARRASFQGTDTAALMGPSAPLPGPDAPMPADSMATTPGKAASVPLQGSGLGPIPIPFPGQATWLSRQHAGEAIGVPGDGQV